MDKGGEEECPVERPKNSGKKVEGNKTRKMVVEEKKRKRKRKRMRRRKKRKERRHRARKLVEERNN